MVENKSDDQERLEIDGIETQHNVEEIDEYPTEQRYVNRYEAGEPRKWVPEGKISEKELDDPEYGTYEVTRYPDAKPTEEDIEGAWQLYNLLR